jgi:hypothetical protein
VIGASLYWLAGTTTGLYRLVRLLTSRRRRINREIRKEAFWPFRKHDTSIL